MPTARPKHLLRRRTPVQRRSRATVDDVLEAAAQVFEEHGYAAGTTNRIAARAGFSIGTLYQYFPSKDAIAVALLERHLDEAVAQLHQWVGQCVSDPRPLRETLELFVHGLLAMHAGRPRLQHILIEETPVTPKVHDAILAAEREAAKTITGLLSRYPEVRHPHLADAAALAVQTVQTLTHQVAAHPALGLPLDVFASELVSMLHAYLTRAPP